MQHEAGAVGPANPDPRDSALEHVALSYAPVIDRRYSVMTTRLTLHTLQSEQPLDVKALLPAIGQAWPAKHTHRVLLNVTSILLVQGLLATRPNANIAIEIPESLAMRADQAHAITRLHEAGATLLVHDYGNLALPPEIQRCFSYVVSGQANRTRRTDGGWAPGLIRIDVRTLEDMQAHFDRGAMAITGWPMATAVQAARFHHLRTPGNMDVILKAVRLSNQGKTLEQIARVIAGDPTLVFQLLRYVNSVSFNLPTKIASIADAITFLGHQKLKRWLAFMLTSVGHRTLLRPTTFAAVRRGLILERLAQMSGNDHVAGDLFVCGILSLIDRMLGRPMDELLDAICASDATSGALVHGRGPYLPYLNMARSLEAGLTYPIYEAAEQLALGMGAINQALLTSMAAAFDMEQP